MHLLAQYRTLHQERTVIIIATSTSTASSAYRGRHLSRRRFHNVGHEIALWRHRILELLCALIFSTQTNIIQCNRCSSYFTLTQALPCKVCLEFDMLLTTIYAAVLACSAFMTTAITAPVDGTSTQKKLSPADPIVEMFAFGDIDCSGNVTSSMTGSDTQCGITQPTSSTSIRILSR